VDAILGGVPANSYLSQGEHRRAGTRQGERAVRADWCRPICVPHGCAGRGVLRGTRSRPPGRGAGGGLAP
jgi:hypothetical protein